MVNLPRQSLITIPALALNGFLGLRVSREYIRRCCEVSALLKIQLSLCVTIGKVANRRGGG